VVNVAVNAIGTTYSEGGSTNEDRCYVIRADEMPIFLGPVRFAVNVDTSDSGTLTVRCLSYRYVGALLDRRPESVGRIIGSGLSAPSFS
jgi:hypothetical protein